MITLIDGVPGAGKSYFLVRYIVVNQDKYHKSYTNINEFKFEKVEKTEKFKQSEFEDIMFNCKKIYDDEDATDEDILNYLIEIYFLGEDRKPNLIVIDEVHNILGKTNDLWVWILTYHRHLFIDFVLATQDFSLIYSKYYKTFQKIYRALPNDRSFKRNNNRYQEHISLPIRDGKSGTFLQNIYIKKEQKYYELYKAGDEVRTKSIFSRFIYMFIILLIVVVGAFIWFISHLVGANKEEKVETNTTIERVVKRYQQVSRNISTNNKTYLKLSCISVFCENKKKHIALHIDDLQYLLKDTDSKYLRSIKYSDEYATVYLLVSSEFLELFNQRSENNGQGFNFIN